VFVIFVVPFQDGWDTLPATVLALDLTKGVFNYLGPRFLVILSILLWAMRFVPLIHIGTPALTTVTVFTVIGGTVIIEFVERLLRSTSTTFFHYNTHIRRTEMTLFIFEPAEFWGYCGGAIGVVAGTFARAVELLREVEDPYDGERMYDSSTFHETTPRERPDASWDHWVLTHELILRDEYEEEEVLFHNWNYA